MCKFLHFFVNRQFRDFAKNHEPSLCCLWVSGRGFNDGQLRSENFKICPCRIPPFHCDLLPRDRSHIAAGSCREVTRNRCLDVDASLHANITLPQNSHSVTCICPFETECSAWPGELGNWGLAIKHTRVGQVVSPQPLATFQSSHRSTDGGVVYAERIGNFLHGVDTGLKGPGHGLAPVGLAAREVRQGLGEWPALGARHFA